jgi:hypothetical protein
VVGNQLSKPYANCAHAYGYYDRDSQWHANQVARSDAQGYYDRDGAWVAGAPNGYYDTSGSWRPVQTAPSSSGYTDAYGRWVPASADGYYDNKNDWVTTASGHYDGEGRWIRGQTSGAYDRYGNWTPGATNGHRDSNGRWIANAQPGYYDGQHRWRLGAAWGYYDTDGRWIATSSGAYDSQADYPNVQARSDVRRDIDSREDRLEQRIRLSSGNGTLRSTDAREDMRSLTSIRRQERVLRGPDGRLSQKDEATLQARLDRLSNELRESIGEDRRS